MFLLFKKTKQKQQKVMWMSCCLQTVNNGAPIRKEVFHFWMDEQIDKFNIQYTAYNASLTHKGSPQRVAALHIWVAGV